MNERELFEAALDITDAAQRSAFLEQACGGNAELRARIDALLASHVDPSMFLKLPVLDQLQSLNPQESLPTIVHSPGSGGLLKPDQGQPVGENIDEEAGPTEPDLSFLNPASQPNSIGRLGHYEILQVLGQGAFGIVFKAFDEKLHRLVAIKAMNPQLAATSPPRKRFLREARSAAAIKHENIVQVYSVEEQPLPYLVMEFIDGATLQQKLDDAGPYEVEEVLIFGKQLADGLAAAHAQGLIHRDIKPGNILLESGIEQRVKITDFGLARAADDASMTQTGFISGTPMYMAPEQATGAALDHRADLFSLGSVLYVMISGRPPFRARNAVAVLKRVAEETPRPIREIIAETPDWLCAIIAKLHAKEPDDRFQSAKEIADLLGQCLADIRANRPVTLPAGMEASASSELELAANLPGSISQRTTSPPRGIAGRKSWLAIAAALLVMLGSLSLTEAMGVTNLRGTVVRLFSAEGTLVVEVDDPEVSVTIDGEELIITGTGAKEIRLKPGEYNVMASKDGKLVRQELVAVTKNGRQVVRVSREAGPTAKTRPKASSNRKPAFLSGDWRMEGEELVQVKPGRGFLMFGNVNWTDYDFTVETLSLGNVENAQGGMIRFRAKTPNIYQELAIGGYAGHLTEVTRMASGKWSRHGNHLSIDHEHDRWYKLLVEVRGPQIRCWVDGVQLFEVEDETILNGMIGLATWNSVVRWKNLKVTSPAGELLYAGFPELPPPSLLIATGQDAPDSQSTSEISPTRYKNSIGMEFALVPKGKAWLGGGSGKVGDKEIEFKEDFYLGVYEVTQEEWEKLMGANPSYFGRQRDGDGKGVVKDFSDADLKRFPVDTVAWDEVQLFLTELNQREKQSGWVYRLPTEAEWEYACRGGPSSDKADYGFDFYLERPSTQLLADQANFGSGLKRTCKVGSYQPNRLGLYDMHGNVFEWCDDEFPPDPKDLQAAPQRILRGGCWSLVASFARASNRSNIGSSTYRHNDRGLRVARVPVAIDPDRRAAEWVVSIGGTVRGSSNPGLLINSRNQIPSGKWKLNMANVSSNPQATDDGLAAFEGCRHVNGLYLSNSPVTDAGLVNFKDCQNLLVLALDHTAVTDEGLAVFKDHKQVEQLCLVGTRVTDKGLELLGNRNVRRLLLAETMVGDKGLAMFKDSPKLATLDVRQTKVTEAGLALFRDCQELMYVHLDGLGIGDTGVAIFKNCNHLRELNLRGTQVGDACVEQLKELHALETIRLQGTKVTAEGVKKVAATLPGCKIEWNGGVIEPSVTGDPDRRATEYVLSIRHEKYTSIRVKQNGQERETRELPEGPFELTGVNLIFNEKVTDEGLASFQGCKNLRVLNLDYTMISDVGLANFKDCKNLTSLYLHGAKVSDAGLAHFADCKDLTSLTLHSVKVTNVGLAHFKNCQNLTSLSLRSSEVNGASLEHFQDCKKLTFLDLAGCRQLDSAELIHFQGCMNLAHLNLDATHASDQELAAFYDCKFLTFLSLNKTNVTDRVLEPLRNCKQLTNLQLENTGVTQAGIDAIKKALPNCQIKWDGESHR